MMRAHRLLWLLSLPSAAAWDPFNIGGGAKEGADELVDRLVHDLVPALQKLIRDEMDTLFDDKLPDFLQTGKLLW